MRMIITEKSADVGASSQSGSSGLAAARWARRHWVALLLALVSLLYGGAVTVLHDDTASPIDELVYIDYTYKTFSQGMVFEGETFGEDVAQLVACESVFPFGTLGQECGSGDIILENMPNAGYTTGAPYTPLYFWITRILGDVIHLVTGLSEVTSWRLTGSLWLAATMVLFTSLARRWKISESVTVTLGLLFVASPFAWWTYTYLSTDVTAFFFGTLLLLVATQAGLRMRSAWWLVPIAFVAAVFKITNMLALGLIILYLLIQNVSSSMEARKTGTVRKINAIGQLSLWAALATSAVVGAAVQIIWSRLIPILAVSEVRVDQGVSRELAAIDLVRLLLSGPGAALVHNPANSLGSGAWFSAFYQPLAWFGIAAVFGALMVMRWSSDRGPLIWATALSTVLALPLLGLTFSLTTGSYFDLPGRYAASLLPGVLLVAGFMLQNKLTKVLLRSYAILLMLAGLVLAVLIRIMF